MKGPSVGSWIGGGKYDMGVVIEVFQRFLNMGGFINDKDDGDGVGRKVRSTIQQKETLKEDSSYWHDVVPSVLTLCNVAESIVSFPFCIPVKWHKIIMTVHSMDFWKTSGVHTRCDAFVSRLSYNDICHISPAGQSLSVL